MLTDREGRSNALDGLVSADVIFGGVEAPFRVHGAGHILNLLAQIVTGWPFEVREASPTASPFFSVTSIPGSTRLLSQTHVQDKPVRELDPVNALCDMVATLPYALADADDTLICLHAAGVQIGDRLVVFPNIRRAGKSTLSCALAMAGHPVFGDDVLPTCFDEEGHAYGRAMGIAPRLRLPLPDTVAPDFRTWVEASPGPKNKQYKYLALGNQPPKDHVRRIGGFVVLDRQDEPCPAQLSPVTADDAMRALLHQNFTRDRHSADILVSVAVTLSSEPCYRLTYFDLQDAVSCLETAFHKELSKPVAPPPSGLRHFRMANLSDRVNTRLVPGGSAQRLAGCVEQDIGGTLYLSDPDGRAIRRLDPLAAAIWSVLEKPIAVPDLESILFEAFPDVPEDRITSDLDKLLRRLAKAGLIASGDD